MHVAWAKLTRTDGRPIYVWSPDIRIVVGSEDGAHAHLVTCNGAEIDCGETAEAVLGIVDKACHENEAYLKEHGYRLGNN